MQPTRLSATGAGVYFDGQGPDGYDIGTASLNGSNLNAALLKGLSPIALR